MKREGRQHGMVQTYPSLQAPWNPRRSGKLASPATTAGPFTRVSLKPTNHSKFTGRCGRPRCACCHVHPAGKSKDKAKGTQRLKSCDVVTNYRLVTWRVVDKRPGLKFTGFSATGILDHLANDCADSDDDDYGDEIDDGSPYADDVVYEYGVDSAIASTSVAIEELDEFDGDGNGDGDEKMSFCDVGFMWEQVEVEVEGDVDGWCLVKEI